MTDPGLPGAAAALPRAFPLSARYPAIAPHHLVRIGRARVYGPFPGGGLVVTDLRGHSVFLGGDHLCAGMRRWLAGQRGQYTILFGPDGMMAEVIAAFPGLSAFVFPFVTCELSSAPPAYPPPPGGPPRTDLDVRRLTAADLPQFSDLGADWLWEHLDGPGDLLAGPPPYGAFLAGRLAAVAASGFQAGPYADLSVATAPDCRRQGAGLAACAALVDQLCRAGLQPAWNTAAAHSASLRLAARLGFAETARYTAVWVR